MGFFSKIKTGNNELAKAIKEGGFLVDVRTSGEFVKGSVKGAVNIPLDEVANQLSKFKDKKNIIVFCRSGARSGQAKSILQKNGFQNVINGGGWETVNRIVKD